MEILFAFCANTTRAFNFMFLANKEGVSFHLSSLFCRPAISGYFCRLFVCELCYADFFSIPSNWFASFQTSLLATAVQYNRPLKPVKKKLRLFVSFPATSKLFSHECQPREIFSFLWNNLLVLTIFFYILWNNAETHEYVRISWKIDLYEELICF